MVKPPRITPKAGEPYSISVTVTGRNHISGTTITKAAGTEMNVPSGTCSYVIEPGPLTVKEPPGALPEGVV